MGKTFLCGTAADVPAMRDVVVISAESGDLTLDAGVEGHSFGNIDFIRCSTYKQVSAAYDMIRLHCQLRALYDSPSMPAEAKKEAEAKLRELQDRMVDKDSVPDPDRLRLYRTVIVDSLSEVEAYCMNQLVGADVGNLSLKMDEEPGTTEWGEYRKQQIMIQRLVRGLRDLPAHVLFTCARGYKEDELKRSSYMPMMTGKLAGQVQGFLDMVGYLVFERGAGGEGEGGSGGLSRRLWIQPGARFQAKSRFSRYRGNYFDNPSMGKILYLVGLLELDDLPAAIKAEVTKPTTPNQPKK